MRWEKFTALLCTVMLLVTMALAPLTAQAAYTLGDVNRSGSIDANDASDVLVASTEKAVGHAHGLTEDQIKAADVDQDGKFDAVDASYILIYSTMKGTGHDVTFDSLTGYTPPVRYTADGFSKYDLLDPDPARAAAAFDSLAVEFCRELYDGYGFEREYGFSTGWQECHVMLATLNHDQGIAPEVLASPLALGDYTEEEVFQYSHTVGFADLEYVTKGKVDFTKYVLDDDLAQFINRMNALWHGYQEGDKEPYKTALAEYCEKNNFSNLDAVEDNLKFYYVVVSAYATYTLGIDSYAVYDAEQLYDERIVRPLYDSYAPYLQTAQ